MEKDKSESDENRRESKDRRESKLDYELMDFCKPDSKSGRE